MADIQYNTVDRTVLIFDNFYKIGITVSAPEYDIVYSYFKGVSDNAKIAGNFTSFMFRIAKDGGYNVLELLETIKGSSKNKLQMNQLICYYLNTFKSKAALYGVGNIPNPNQAIQRNVVL